MSSPRILLVDDDAEICEFLATLLEVEGMAPITATRAEEALRLVEDAAAVLVDVAMPGVDGLELCRRIRAAGYTGPVLVVSARPGADLPRRASDAGANDFVRKPFDNAELVSRLRALVGESTAASR